MVTTMARNSLDNPDVGTERQESLASDLDQHFMDLLEASSLGTPAASRIRAATSANVVDDVRRRLNAGWREDALCRHDPELFQVDAAQNQAKLICRGCPVRTECLAEALDSGNEFGVWGGMTERERLALLRRRPHVTSWRDLLERARDRYLRQGIDASAGGTADRPHGEKAHPPADAQPVAVRVARPADLQLCLVSPEQTPSQAVSQRVPPAPSSAWRGPRTGRP
jgi:WhiB family transcriptional regulator, redox-sensing transcriptional regulator